MNEIHLILYGPNVYLDEQRKWIISLNYDNHDSNKKNENHKC